MKPNKEALEYIKKTLEFKGYNETLVNFICQIFQRLYVDMDTFEKMSEISLKELL